jgi:hypothetical protein
MKELEKLQFKTRKQSNREERTLSYIIAPQEITHTLNDRIFKVFCFMVCPDFFFKWM